MPKKQTQKTKEKLQDKAIQAAVKEIVKALPAPAPFKAQEPRAAPEKKKEPMLRLSEPSEVELFFDVRDSGYWFKLSGVYVKLGTSELDDEFRALGLRDDLKIDGLDELRWVKRNARHNRQIHYAGQLAGYKRGAFRDEQTGKAYLITDEPFGVWEDLPKRTATRPDWIWAFMEELLDQEQAMVFSYWLSFSLRSLRRCDFAPGQAVVLAGPSDCGKSLLQYITTQVLGGRCADPMEYMLGETNFNKKMVESEHWQIEDLSTKGSSDIRTRRLFGEILKRCVINERFAIHHKGKDSTDMPIFRRVSVSINRETENLSKLPPLDDSLLDKMMLLNCNKATETLAQFKPGNHPSLIPEASPDGKPDRLAIRKKVASELQQFRHWLLSLPTLPTLAQDSRMGIRSYYNPELFAELSSLEPSVRLLTIIDAVLFAGEGPHNTFKGQSVDLEETLRKSEKLHFETEKVLRHSAACGSYLGKLAKSHPERVSKHALRVGSQVWIVKPPTQEQNQNAVS